MNHQPPAARARPRLAPAIIAAGALVLSGSLLGWNAEARATDYPSTPVAAPPAAPPTQSGIEQLDQLVAPIALYPDQLVAEVLAAATYPAEVVEADRWMQAHSQLKGNALAAAVDAEPWDGSVKAMIQFPQVLAMMDKNLSWTASLGEAYVRDSQSVMSAVQQLRARAEQAGNLESTPQENVTNEDQTIVIEPSDPEVVYVPDYDPWLVYGEPMVLYSGWVPMPGLFIGGTGIYFGIGTPILPFGGFGWGWNHWRPDWHGHGVFFDHHPFAPHGLAWAHDRPGGFDHPGAFGRPGESGHGPVGFGHPAVFGHPGDFGHGPGSFGHPAAFGHPGEMSHGVGFTGGFPSDAFSHGPTGGFAAGGFAHAAAPAGFAAGGHAGFGGFHGGGAHFGGAHGGGGHR